MCFQMMCALCNIIYYLEPKEASKSISQCSKPTCAKYRTHGLYVAPPPSLAARGRAISCALPRSRFLPQGRQPNPTHVLPGVHCPAHSLLLYIRAGVCVRNSAALFMLAQTIGYCIAVTERLKSEHYKLSVRLATPHCNDFLDKG